MLLGKSSQPRPLGVGAQHHQAQLEAVDSQPKAPSLAGSLAHLLFTAEEMATQNATPARTTGIKLLDDQRHI